MAQRFPGTAGRHPLEIDQGTLCRNQSPKPGSIRTEGSVVPKLRAWMARDIEGYQQWVQTHGFDYVKNLTIDCADFAIYLLSEYAKRNNLRLGFTASFSFRDPFASRRMNNPTLSESMKRLGANDLFDSTSGNTVEIDFQELRSGDLLASKVHVQVVMSHHSLIAVKDIVNKTSQSNVPAMEIIQGNLGSGQPVLVQRRAYDLRATPDGARDNSYYEFNDVHKYYYPAGNTVDELTEFQPRRWNFARFNTMFAN